MKAQTFVNRVYNLLSILYICAKLNILFLLGTLLGGIIFGLGPSLIASHELAKDYYQGKGSQTIAKFVRVYRQEFKRANSIFLPFELIIVLLLLDIRFINDLNWIQYSIVNNLFLSISILLMSYFTLIAPIYIFYEVDTKRYHRTLIQFAIRNLAPLLLAIIWIGFCVVVSFSLPGLIPFYSFGTWIFVNQGIYLQTFERNERLINGSD